MYRHAGTGVMLMTGSHISKTNLQLPGGKQ